MHGVLASPSKLRMSPVPENAEGSSTVELRRQVPYSTFLKHGQNIADLVTFLCPLAQNVVSAHFSKVYELLSDGDYSNARHNGTCVDGLANALAGIGVPDRSAAGPDMPKQRVVTTRGRNALHRLGSNQSTVSGNKEERKCTFCRSQGDANSYHKNKSCCPVKAEYGDCSESTSARDAKTITCIANKLDEIIKGKQVGFRDVAVVIGAEDFH